MQIVTSKKGDFASSLGGEASRFSSELSAGSLSDIVNTDRCVVSSRKINGVECLGLIYDNLGDTDTKNDLKIDLFLPHNARGARLPLVVRVHSGGWQSGNRTTECGDSTPLVNEGFAVACVEYRLTRQSGNQLGESHAAVSFPTPIQDVKTAVQWLRANAGDVLNPNRFGAHGHSAGGHLVALLGTSAGVAGIEGRIEGISSSVQAVVASAVWTDWSLVLDANWIEGNSSAHRARVAIEALHGFSMSDPAGASVRSQSNPVTHVDANDPPFLLFHGDKDEVAHIGAGLLLYDTLVQKNVNATMNVIPGGDHSMASKESNASNADVVAFFREMLSIDKALVPAAPTNHGSTPALAPQNNSPQQRAPAQQRTTQEAPRRTQQQQRVPDQQRTTQEAQRLEQEQQRAAQAAQRQAQEQQRAAQEAQRRAQEQQRRQQQILDERVTVYRLFNGRDHMDSGIWGEGGYGVDYSYQLFKNNGPGRVAIYRCNNVNHGNHFLSHHQSCEGNGYLEGLMGYALRSHDGNTRPFYRLYNHHSWDNMSGFSWGEGGYTTEFVLGYVPR